MAAGFIVLLFGARDRFTRRRVIGAVTTATAIVVGVLIAGWQSWQPLLSKFADTFDFSSGNGAYRVVIQRLALDDMQSVQTWVFGLGTNSFSQRHVDPSRPGMAVEAFLGNLPLQIVYDSGIIGLSIILFLTAALLRSSHFSVSSLAVMSAFIVVASATSPFWFATTWIFAALAVLPRDPDLVSPSRDPEGNFALRVSSGVL
jgi:hypothetical protein